MAACVLCLLAPQSTSSMPSSKVTSSLNSSLIGQEIPTVPPPGFAHGTCPTNCQHVHFPNSTLGVLKAQPFPWPEPCPPLFPVSLPTWLSLCTRIPLPPPLNWQLLECRDCSIQLPKYLNEARRMEDLQADRTRKGSAQRRLAR